MQYSNKLFPVDVNMKWWRVVGLVMAIAVTLIMSGCAAPGQGLGYAQGNLDSLIASADTEVENGRTAEAIALLDQAAKEHPTSMVPWLRMADIWFEAGNYPSSIMAANEVLQRDADNQDAKSLLVVAGLRVAASAVSGLRPNGAVGTATRVEAEDLTNSLRGMLGEKILVPAPTAATSGRRYVPRRQTAAVAVPERAASPEPARSPRAAALDPFRSLK